MHSSLKVYIYHVTLEFIVILLFFIWFWVLDESVAFIFFPACWGTYTKAGVGVKVRRTSRGQHNVILTRQLG